MKIFLYAALLVPLAVLPQKIKGSVQDSISGEKLQLVNMSVVSDTYYYGSNSNLEGNYELNINGHNKDTIKISHIGYKPKFIALNKFNENKDYVLDIKLQHEQVILEDVVVNAPKNVLRHKHVFKKRKEGNLSHFSLVGFESACLIENPRKELGRLKSLKLYVRKNAAADFIAKFRIKFYSYDAVNNKPGENLLKEDLIITPKNKTYQLVIDVENKQIPFPEDGVCVGVELVDENNFSKKGDKIGPGLRFTYGEKDNLTWSNYRNNGWHSSRIHNRTHDKTANLLVGLVVLMKD
ncbi:MAG: hypothetical protein CFE24_10525 [Flavobacterium sp. BFFFF2]|nr:MAG: hypothetical protein CFE24_10525 [Flavobacterium sp. BFFFF2]